MITQTNAIPVPSVYVQNVNTLDENLNILLNRVTDLNCKLSPVMLVTDNPVDCADTKQDQQSEAVMKIVEFNNRVLTITKLVVKTIDSLQI